MQYISPNKQNQRGEALFESRYNTVIASYKCLSRKKFRVFLVYICNGNLFDTILRNPEKKGSQTSLQSILALSPLTPCVASGKLINHPRP